MTFINVYEIVGILVTIAGAVATYFKSQRSAKKLNVVFVTILGTILTMLISLRFGVLPEVGKHMAVTEEIRQVPNVTKLIHRLAEARKISNEDSLMGYVLKIRLENLERQLDRVEVGEFTVEQHEMPDFVIRLIETATRSFDATSYVQFNEWWDTPWGRRYEKLNIDAVRRGVAVSRTFIFSSKEELDAARAHLDKQVNGGIKVRYAIADALGIQVTSDMVVVDGKLAGELRLTPDKGMKQAEFFTQSRDVKRIHRRIQALKLEAREYVATPK